MEQLTNMAVLRRIDASDVRDIPGTIGAAKHFKSVRLPSGIGNGTDQFMVVHDSLLRQSYARDGKAVPGKMDLQLDMEKPVVVSFVDENGRLQQTQRQPVDIVGDWLEGQRFSDNVYLGHLSRDEVSFRQDGRVVAGIPDRESAPRDGEGIGRSDVIVEGADLLPSKSGGYFVFLGGKDEPGPEYRVYLDEPDPETGLAFKAVEMTAGQIGEAERAGREYEAYARVKAREADIAANRVVLRGVDEAHVHFSGQPGGGGNYVLAPIGGSSADGYGKVPLGPDAIVPSVDQNGDPVPGRFDVTLQGRLDGKSTNLVTYDGADGKWHEEAVDSARLLELWEEERIRQAETEAAPYALKGVNERLVTVGEAESKVRLTVFDRLSPVEVEAVVPTAFLMKGVEPHSYDVGLPDGMVPVRKVAGNGEVAPSMHASVMESSWDNARKAAELARGETAWLLGIDPAVVKSVDVPSADGSTSMPCKRIMLADMASSPLEGAMIGYGRLKVHESAVYPGFDGKLDVYLGRERDLVPFEGRLGERTADQCDVWSDTKVTPRELIHSSEMMRRMYGSACPDVKILVPHTENTERIEEAERRAQKAKGVLGIQAADMDRDGRDRGIMD